MQARSRALRVCGVVTRIQVQGAGLQDFTGRRRPSGSKLFDYGAPEQQRPTLVGFFREWKRLSLPGSNLKQPYRWEVRSESIEDVEIGGQDPIAAPSGRRHDDGVDCCGALHRGNRIAG